MRALADAGRIRAFLHELGKAAPPGARAYLTGGATAVMLGWRGTTIDVDIKLVPEADAMFRAIARLKDELQLNVELASPSDFIPPLPGWEDRSRFALQAGPLAVFHYDLYSQALAKIERGHSQDVVDVSELVRRGLVEPARLLELFGSIEADLIRYPAIDPAGFRRAVEAVARGPH